LLILTVRVVSEIRDRSAIAEFSTDCSLGRTP
jgi:hypothetical protein